MDLPGAGIDNSIPERFEKIASLYPNRLAVKIGGESVTYDELNRYANRIAHAIIEKRGLGSEPIALFFEKSIELVAAIFGVLKAGKFYVVLIRLFPPRDFISSWRIPVRSSSLPINPIWTLL